MHVGELIRKFRKEREMTLLELADKSHVALATLSRIENGRMTGTLQSHMNICEALDLTLPELYKDLPSSKKTLEAAPRSAKPSVSLRNKKSSSEMLISNPADKKMMPVVIRMSVGGSTNAEESKSGIEKFIYVLDGKVEAVIGEAKYSLSKGDTLYFAASVAHHFRNTAHAESRLLVVASPPE